MSRPVIFLGPTLPQKNAAAVLDAVYLSPAAQGDIVVAHRAYNPRFIGIIDGFFECVPSVWHKEILFVMSQGTHVAGASSMGALRAAELHQFGMTGIGEVFRSYKSGLIEDDDEVAVVHGPEAVGYPLLSEAMVNIRKTCGDARDRKVITGDESRLLISTAKSLHYKDRAYDNILNAAAAAGLPASRVRRFKSWLPAGRRDLKAEDARELLLFIKNQEKMKPGPKQVQYEFQNTVMWTNLLESIPRISG